MYRCDLSKKVVSPNIPCNIICVEFRHKAYLARAKANKLLDPGKPGENKTIYSIDLGGQVSKPLLKFDAALTAGGSSGYSEN